MYTLRQQRAAEAEMTELCFILQKRLQGPFQVGPRPEMGRATWSTRDADFEGAELYETSKTPFDAVNLCPHPSTEAWKQRQAHHKA